ncbi:MAG: hypothetical protein JEZ06_20635 [Anaerolineaceae bacterium]|nr:hypothetical protein [Anaerolineaceae bacterium]
MSPRLKQAKCENCGAPLSRDSEPGQYICQFCNVLYLDEEYSGKDWKPDVEAEPKLKPVHEFSPQPAPAAIATSAVDFNKSKKKKFQILPLLLVAGFAGCVLIGLASMSLAGGSSVARTAQEAVIDPKPDMLSVLPEAIMAGETIAYHDWELTVSPQISVNDGEINLNITMKNWMDGQQTLRYIPEGLVVYDDLRNTYPVSIGNCDIDLPYLEREVYFDIDQEIEFSSTSYWCNKATVLPPFSGIIPGNAQHLYLLLKNFGAFNDITFVYDL